MPGTRRTPINRPPTGGQITDAAVALYDAMRRCKCVCPPIDWDGAYWERSECAGCRRWWELHSQLHDELKLAPWAWPAIENPHPDASPYPRAHHGHDTWAVPDAQARWRKLDAASRELRRQKRAARRAARRAALEAPAPTP
jgi:hypothetical protein